MLSRLEFGPPKDPDPLSAPRWPMRFRARPFAASLVISAVMLAALACWIVLDAGFNRYVIDVVRGRLMDGEPLARVIVASPRMIGCTLLAVLATGSTLTAIYLAFVDPSHGRRWRRFAAVSLLAAWIGLYASRQTLAERGFQLRVNRALPGLRQDAAVLTSAWPREEQKLPFSGRCFPLPAAPDVLCRTWRPGMTIRSPYLLSVATFGFIYRVPEGNLRFEVVAEDWASIVEYRPDGSQPESFDQSYGDQGVLKHRLKRSRQLAPEWFLADYEKTW